MVLHDLENQGQQHFCMTNHGLAVWPVGHVLDTAVLKLTNLFYLPVFIFIL